MGYDWGSVGVALAWVVCVESTHHRLVVLGVVYVSGALIGRGRGVGTLVGPTKPEQQKVLCCRRVRLKGKKILSTAVGTRQAV